MIMTCFRDAEEKQNKFLVSPTKWDITYNECEENKLKHAINK